ncbi:helix-turn-helix transcriptional regulator [Pleurocapsales cyanobacterium LEGE 06147]|nr:helix-turn-helix transcriptional regulator [Pleurocapsales cyanobacterium LEGE 06147]
MTITISQGTYWELVQEVKAIDRPNLPDKISQTSDPSDDLDTTWIFPKSLGEGFIREIQLREGLWLAIERFQLRDRLLIDCPEREHPLEYNFMFSGGATDNSLELHPGQYNFYGSGMAPKETPDWSDAQPIFCVGVLMKPEVLRSFVGNPVGELPIPLEHLIRRSDQEYYNRAGIITPAMQRILQQILHCPYGGISKHLDLEGNVLRLTALLLEQETQLQTGSNIIQPLKLGTLERIYYAREILLKHLDNPPSLTELAQRVKLNEYTLKQGFRQVFNTTVFGYLHEYRLEQARQLLNTGEMKVTEVAEAVGFASRSYFAIAFRKKFGLNPKEYLMQQKRSR